MHAEQQESNSFPPVAESLAFSLVHTWYEDDTGDRFRGSGWGWDDQKRGSAGTRLSLLSIASCGFWESGTNCLEYLYE